MLDENLKKVLSNYDEILKIVLEQKIDEYSDRLDEKPQDDEDLTYETFLQREAMREAKEQGKLMESQENDLLGGKSMNEYFRGLSFEELTEILEYCATELDRGVPDSVTEALSKIPDSGKVRDYAIKTVNDAAWVDEELKDEDKLFEIEFQKVVACLKVLADMKDGSLVQVVLDRFMSYPGTRDFVADSIAGYIESFPETAVPLLISRLEENKEDGLQGPCEDLVIILTNIGKKEASDQIYDALRMSFRYMKNKIYAVICLADYGDKRAVPMLKTYINRHQSTIDRDLFYEMMSAIQNLGGDISDISDPFGDFQKKFKK